MRVFSPSCTIFAAEADVLNSANANGATVSSYSMITTNKNLQFAGRDSEALRDSSRSCLVNLLSLYNTSISDDLLAESR